ncbi:MAG TPA: IS21-like element helper ATPase IstB [Armatimonadota bacterium]
MKLSGILNTLSARVELAQSQQLSPLEFLALLLEDEIDRRHQHVLERREHEAGFERPKRLSQFDFAALPTLDRAFILRQASCEFIARQENWLLYGPTGVGKSHLAIAVGYEALSRGYRVLAASTHRLLAGLYAARADGTYPRRFQKLSSVDLLILDDFGLRPVSAAGAEDLYEILQRRYERGSILLTSNRAPSEWAEVFGDGLLASAALDRLTHHAQLTALTGESYRQRQRRSLFPQEGGSPSALTES